MLDRPEGSGDALLVSIDFGEIGYEESLEELKQLAISAGIKIRGVLEGNRDRPDAKYFIGSGKAEELSEMVKATESRAVVFNHDLSPSQQRNLERLLESRVADRTGLILDIFAQRAKSHEGKLQVELAQLEHLSTRLIRGWTHLERQKGGIGVRGGPGETQLELDRRMLRIRVKQLREKLLKLKQQRGIDWQGAAQVRQLYPNAVSIFILPPSMTALESRLRGRAQDSEEVILKRLGAARDEMSHVGEFDYVTINDKFEESLQDLVAIVRAVRLKCATQLTRHAALIKGLI